MLLTWQVNYFEFVQVHTFKCSVEFCIALDLEVVHHIKPPLLRNIEHALEILHGKCTITVLFFTTAMAYLPATLLSSLVHINTSPTAGLQISLYMW